MNVPGSEFIGEEKLCPGGGDASPAYSQVKLEIVRMGELGFSYRLALY